MKVSTPHLPWTPRESIRMRLDRDGEDLGLTAAPLIVDDFADRFPKALAREAQRVLDELADDLRALDTPGLPAFRVTLDDDDWSVNGGARIDSEGGMVLTLSIGFAMAVEEATLAFLAYDDALCPRALLVQPDRPRARLQAYDCDPPDDTPRYYDYRHLRGGAFAPEHVTTSFPVDLWRLRQQDLLFRLILRWAALHEIAHAGLRHNELLALCFPDLSPDLGLAEGQTATTTSRFDPDVWRRFSYETAPEVKPTEGTLRRVCELHADVCALWLGFDLEAIAGHQGLFDRFADDMTGLVDDPDAQFAAFADDERVYLLGFAATAALVLFENARRHQGEPADTHPLPEARIITLVDAAFYGSPFTAPDGQGGFKIVLPADYLWNEETVTPWTRFMQDAIAPIIEDLHFLAEVIDLDFDLLTFDVEQADAVPINRYVGTHYFKAVRDLHDTLASPWWRDLLARNEAALSDSPPPPPLSAGGRDLTLLDPLQPHINWMSEVLQAALNGGLVSFGVERRAAGAP